MVDWKSFVYKVMLRIKWKFKLQFDLLFYPVISDEATRFFKTNFELSDNFELTMFKLTVPDLYFALLAEVVFAQIDLVSYGLLIMGEI